MSQFHFTITDAARFLGKSPVTLRKWERQGLVSYPRLGGSGDRYFKLDDIRDLVYCASELGRISIERQRLVLASITLLEIIENANNSR